jgi:hypothetical protein
MESKCEGAKQAALSEILGELEILTRLEFEIRREQFRYWNEKFIFDDEEIHTVDDWHTMRAQVIYYLMTEWIRFAEVRPDFKNNHQDKAEEWAAWVKLREMAVKILEEDNAIELNRPEPGERDGRHLLDQALGCMINYQAKFKIPVKVAEAGRECVKTFDDFVKSVPERCRDKYGVALLRREKAEKRKQMRKERAEKKAKQNSQESDCDDLPDDQVPVI